MGAPRGDSAVTKQAILRAARELFAARGVSGVSVRDIAAAAGVNHALVHRYFGTKDEMVAAILSAEAERMSSMGRPDAEAATSLAALEAVLEHALSEGRTSLLLMLRAELDGLGPERMLEGQPLRALPLLHAWLARNARDDVQADADALTMVMGAAMLGLASCRPMLATAVGAAAEDDQALLHRCVRVLVEFAAMAIARPGEESGRPADGHDKERDT